MTGILEMFAELDEAAQYHCTAQLELWGWRQRAAQRERLQRWREQHREAVREKQRIYMADRYATDEAFRQRKIARQKQYDATPAEQERRRAYQRARYAAQRAA